MGWLPNGENVLKICLFFLTESTNVADRRTHVPTVMLTRTFHQGPGPGPGLEYKDQDKDKDLSKCGYISVNIPDI